MANTTADKLAKLNTTKEDLKAALAEKGQTVGDVFSAYPAAVRAIESGPKSANISADFYGNIDGEYITYIGADQKLMENIPLSSVYSINVINPSFIYFSMSDTSTMRISGNIKRMTGISNSLFFVSGHCSISYEG